MLNNKIEFTNIIIGFLIFLANFFFIPFSISIIINGGGPFGFGLIILPPSIIINLFLVSSLFLVKKSVRNSNLMLIINLIGLIFSLIMLYLVLKESI